MSTIGAMAARRLATTAMAARVMSAPAPALRMMAASATVMTLFGNGVGRVRAHCGGDASW
jgi:hypothetical protein